MKTIPYCNRREAGIAVAEALVSYRGRPDVAILAITPHSVALGIEVAKFLVAPLDLFLVRTLHSETTPDAIIAGVSSGGLSWTDAQRIEPGDPIVQKWIATERINVEAEEKRLRGDEPESDSWHLNFVLVDDGLSTGHTMQTAVRLLRQRNPVGIIVATPIGTQEACQHLAAEVTEVVCLTTVEQHGTEAAYYVDPSALSETEIRSELKRYFRVQPVA